MANESQGEDSEARNQIEYADLERLAASESPDFAGALETFLEQPDPEPKGELPKGALSVEGFATAVARAKSARGKVKRSTAAREVWSKFLAQEAPPLPPRFRLGDLLVGLYEKKSEGGRAVLHRALASVEFRYGVWSGVKRIYKRAEAELDAETFGLLAWRFDTGERRGDVSPGTLLYLRRRAWRFLRELGDATPELYPQFAAQVLRRYPSRANFASAWVANHIWAHQSKKYDARSFEGVMPPADLVKNKAFAEAWKRAPDSLMYVLEACENDAPARFAIENLRKDFPERLRDVTPVWLARLARRSLPSAHEFLVETLQASPEFHQGKLRALGLHEGVLALLLSASKKARTYAIEYARAHAADMPTADLAALLEDDGAADDTLAFALQMLQAHDPRALGAPLLGRLLAVEHAPSRAFAAKTLDERFDRSELGEGFLIEMLFGNEHQLEWAKKYTRTKYRARELSVAFWQRVVADERATDHDDAVEIALEALATFPLASLGAGWLLDAVTKPALGARVGAWLKAAEALPGLDVERVKGLVFNPAYREVALSVLGNTKLVKPRELGLGWLLALARRADPSLHDFAHRYLLEHMKPEDFADGGDRAAGIERLFALATGDKEPEPVRVFAQLYLRCHHPVLGPEQTEAKQLSLKPALAREAFEPERIWSSLFDERADVRRFAVTIARADLRHWGYQTRVYELAEADAKEVRNLAYEALLKAGEAAADPAHTLRVDELEGARVFAMTESRKRTTREVAMEVIRKHYVKLGGPQRLAWLMESADREVRLFAVRLLWERHRPRTYPADWRFAKPRVGAAQEGEQGAGLEQLESLRGLLRRMLFGLPPGRAMEAIEQETGRTRLSASVAKRNTVELVRDFGLENAQFAHFVAPVLGEFTGSLAKGEWQTCLAALARLRTAHPTLDLGGIL